MNKNTISTFSAEERCPWYELVYRIILIVFGAVVIYCIGFSTILASLWIITKMTGRPVLHWVVSTLSSHPILTIILLIVGFIAALFYSLVQLARVLQQL